ncbi:MAG TPA: hypothetical protein PK629_11570 [Oscillospiraceae bacterium]|nr:hypothetical protein [Oscillospiraceae bacterium]HPF55004.1 hypothetical protein [Clostridiales bacterium]HPK35928.1 hypothetical protein [Oscillospiraceae bacterium]HPR75622.1 hypothetical protein [Oscillospiraceae bacterium]
MADQKYTRDICIALLREKQQSLTAQGTERYPQRSDFDIEAVVAIKAFLGPWPRALEAAGLKPVRPEDHKQRTREKHIRAKRDRNKVKRETDKKA